VVELITLALHAILYLAFFLFLLGPALGLMVVLIQKVTGGIYVALVFAPNHKGMPQTTRVERPGFLERQVLTARNVKASRVKDLIYGSLNYQIEHHLFPSMPRRNIRKASKIIKQYCDEIDLPYHEATMLQSYRELLGFLDEIGRSVRATA
jgi:fatty acid desaturase